MYDVSDKAYIGWVQGLEVTEERLVILAFRFLRVTLKHEQIFMYFKDARKGKQEKFSLLKLVFAKEASINVC